MKLRTNHDLWRTFFCFLLGIIFLDLFSHPWVRSRCVLPQHLRQCPKGLFNKTTKQLQPNPECLVHQPNLELLRKNATLTFAMLYYSAQTMFCAHLANWMSWPPRLLKQVQFLIIDDGSPESLSASKVLNSSHVSTLNIRIAKIQQDFCWNVGGARNLAVHLSATDGIFLMDLDTFAPQEMVEYLLPRVKTKKFYIFFPRESTPKPHPAIAFFNKQKYWEVGGCDEDFVGYYGKTDPHFRYRIHTHKMPQTEVFGDHKAPKLSDGLKFQKHCPPSPFVPMEKDPDRNAKLYEEKKKSQDWSTTYLRFNWHEVSLTGITQSNWSSAIPPPKPSS